MTIEVEATNWMLALRHGLDEIGADRSIIKRAICDIKADNTIHVMEPEQGRVFVLKDLSVPPPGSEGSERDTRPTIKKPSTVTHASNVMDVITTEIPRWAVEAASQAKGNARSKDTSSPRNVTVPSGPAQSAPEAVGPGEVTTSAPSMEELGFSKQPLAPNEIRRKRPKRSISHLDLEAFHEGDTRIVSREPSREIPNTLQADLQATQREAAELFAEVFEALADIDLEFAAVEEVLQNLLELAVCRIPSEAGWLLLADMNRRDLYFATATGPKAAEVINYRLPMGRGIAGFCAVNGVSLALADVEQDPRFQTTVSKSVGYHIESVACAPVQHEGRVYGAIQIMNHQKKPEYTPGEIDVLTYIARRTAEYLASHVEMS